MFNPTNDAAEPMSALSMFRPEIPHGWEDQAVAEACAACRFINDGGHVEKYLIVARGIEVLAARAQQMSNSNSRAGRRYNEALSRQLSQHPELGELAKKSKAISGACWILQNWATALPYIQNLRPSQLIDFNPHSLRVSIMRSQKNAAEKKEPGEKPPAPREIIAKLSAENESLQNQVRKLENDLFRSESNGSQLGVNYNIVKDEPEFIAEELVKAMSGMKPLARKKQITGIIAGLRQMMVAVSRNEEREAAE